jgi:excisionase family DNA binding protein
MTKPVLDVREASQLLDISDRTLRMLTRSGKIPAARIGNQWRYSRSVLMSLIEKNGVSGGEKNEVPTAA